MKAATRRMIGAAAVGICGALLTVNAVSISYADTEDTSGVPTREAVASVDRFTGTPSYCQAFLGVRDFGTDGVTSAYSVALVDAIRANAGNAERTISMIREKCSRMV
jgi:hypothetical protein